LPAGAPFFVPTGLPIHVLPGGHGAARPAARIAPTYFWVRQQFFSPVDIGLSLALLFFVQHSFVHPNPASMKEISCDPRTVEVFRTSVHSPVAAGALLRQLRQLFPGWRISFDLDDCDRVLRVESPGTFIPNDCIRELLRQSGFGCEPLPD